MFERTENYFYLVHKGRIQSSKKFRLEYTSTNSYLQNTLSTDYGLFLWIFLHPYTIINKFRVKNVDFLPVRLCRVRDIIKIMILKQFMRYYIIHTLNVI